MIDISTLNPAQLEAVTAPDGPVLVIAGAGSGKTRTIVHRLAWLAEQGVPASDMLLLTFTRKASREMLLRATDLLGYSIGGVHGGTFHSFAFSVLRQYRPAWAEGPVTVMDSADSASAIQQCKERLKVGKGDRSFPKTQTIIGLLSKARNKEISIGDVLQRDAQHLLPHADALESIGEAYRGYRRQHGLLDYDDLLFELEDLLKGDPEAGREGLAERFRERYRYIMVDEYQDTNRVQARLVRLLAGEAGNVMAVGDDAQSIYAFRGATIRNMLALGSVVAAPTLDELAKKTGMDPKKLEASVAGYNAVVEGKAKDPLGFVANNKDDKTLTGGPWYACRKVPTVHHTMGGLEINTKAQVIGVDGKVIPGLYAAGEVTGGIHGSNRLGGNAIADVMVFGRTAGTNAATLK